MSGYAPIALFVYRRTDMLGRIMDALEACPEFVYSDVFIFSDGAKVPAAAADVEAVRLLVKRRLRPNMKLIQAQGNNGLAQSIIEGVTRLSDEYGRVIVIEDDLVVSPVLLNWWTLARSVRGRAAHYADFWSHV